MNTGAARVKVLIVDDEKKACVNLKNLLTEYVDPQIEIAGIANSTAQAFELIEKVQPDAVFLDIQMPNENAFEFLERIGPINFEVIFVTAYDEFAVRAFKLNAIDYILKPISVPELSFAVKKLRERLAINKLIAENHIPFSELAGQVTNKVKPGKITLKGVNRVEVVDFRDICFIEALSSYSKIQFVKDNSLREITMSNPLSDYEEMLPMDVFFRIHRSYLVNCTHLVKISGDETTQVVLKPNFMLPVSRRRLSALKEFLKNNEYYNE